MIRLIFWFPLILIRVAGAQNIIVYPDAQLAGLGYAMAAVKQEGPGIGNPAGQSSSAARFSFSKPLDLEGMDFQSVSIGVVRQRSTYGLGVSSVGNPIFKQNILSVQFGHRIGNTTMAVRNELFQFTGENRTTRLRYGLSLGSLTRLSEKITTGVYLSNINSLTESVSPIVLPVRMAIGLAYHPAKELLLAVECSKDIRQRPAFRVGLEYEIVRRVLLRVGTQVNTSEIFVGTGFRFWKLITDYAFQYSRQKGVILTASSSIRLNKKAD